MVFKILGWSIVGGYALITLLYLIRLGVFAKHLRRAKRLERVRNFKKEMVFVLPMYKEQKLAKDTFEFFVNIAKKRPNTKAIFVTTIKEKAEKGKQTTHDILSGLINDDNKDFVRLYMYPHKTGVMAHQVNYGVKSYFDEVGNNDSWVAIYNCDSRLSEESLNEIYYNVHKANNDTVFQQYSYYFVPDKKGRSIPLSSAGWQTRWSIFKENAVARNKNIVLDWNLKNKKVQALIEPFVYCIGHGCIANINTFMTCGGMPEDTINEDCFMGYVFNCENKRIVPLYNLEKAESVSSTKALIQQQTSWYNGPVDSLNYYKHYKNGTTAMLKRPTCKEEDKFRAKVLAWKSFNYAIHWICSPFLLLVALPICMGLAYGWMGLIIPLIVAEIYLFGINFIMYLYLKTQDIHIPCPSLVFDILFYVCHGLSAVIWVIKNIFKKHDINNKYKTER